ncbi:hypothetical protein C8R46DRAFT_1217891 [Mycena filopes]|nr:hypothetical protein C8R46DRAFT_1217891 [Mycena filopes]
MEKQNRPLSRFVLAIPEILDHVLDHLSDSRRDLLACALVSKLWVPRAQFHIFREIELLPPSRWDNSQPHVRLLEVLQLEASRHLATLVRHVSFSLSPRLLECLASVDFPNLKEISVHCTDDQYSWRTDIATKQLVADLFMSLPTLLRVNLVGILNSISVFHAYFDNCAANIQSLNMQNVGVELSEEDQSLLDPPASLIPARMALSHLSIPFDSTVLESWLFAARSPFNLSRLKTLQLDDAQWTKLRNSFASSCTSIEDLCLSDFSGEVAVDLGMLTALKKLDVETHQLHFPQLLAALERLPPHSVLQTLILRLYAVTPKDEGKFNVFDAKVASLGIAQSLRRVEIHLAARQYLRTDPILDIPTFESYLPFLASRGQLSIYREFF